MEKKEIIKRLDEKDFIINQLGLKFYELDKLIKELSSEKDKKRLLEIYDDVLMDTQKIRILKTFSSSSKLEIILENNYLRKFTKYVKIDLLTSLDIEDLIAIFSRYRGKLNELNIRPYEIVFELNSESQRDIAINIEKINLSINEKKEILASLSNKTKQSLDFESFSEEYKTALNMQTKRNDYYVNDNYAVVLDINFDFNIEDYRGLEIPIKINPEELTQEQRIKFIKLCEFYPDILVVSTVPMHHDIDGNYISTANEYIEGEKWIESVVNDLKPEYSTLQKIAIIDNAIGKKISYSPDFDTEIFDDKGCRALWKIINSGYGVCNGIANLERYILKRAGIEAELISGENHAFLKVKDAEKITTDGKIIKGDTILDPTWNLTAHRFGARPNNFCISYEKARKMDIDEEGYDHYCHFNNEELQEITFELDDNELRRLFTSVGLADKTGKFPIEELIEKSKEIDRLYANDTEKNISNQLLIFSKLYPEFAICQNSSISVLKDIIFNNKNLNFEKCFISRVYNKNDDTKSPIIYIYVNSKDFGSRFYYADKDKKQFLSTSIEKFTQQFECYEKDLEKYGRI